MELEEVKISIRYQNQYGYIGFDPATKRISVQLDNVDKRGEVERYLNEEQIIPISTEGLGEFIHSKLLASTGMTEFKAVLTCLWNVTGVEVDWSRPVI
jgi:hypothetical protein